MEVNGPFTSPNFFFLFIDFLIDFYWTYGMLLSYGKVEG